MRQPRSIACYAWVALAIQALLAGAVTVFILAGAAYQRSAITAAVLAAGLLLPMIVVALVTRWTSRPLKELTHMVRWRAQGGGALPTVPGGPAEVRDLVASVNYLADSGDRLQNMAKERTRLLMSVHQASVRIRQHLHAGAVIREAVTALREHLAVDFAWVGLVSGEGVQARAGGDALGEATGITGPVPADAVSWLADVYTGRSSYHVPDLRSAAAGELPAGLRGVLAGHGAASLLLTPFGAGSELLGALALLRSQPGQPWRDAEIEAVQYLAEDIGRGLEHARLYEGEEHLVAELQSLDQAKTSFIAAASHDVRTPLTSILGNMELLTEGEAGPVPPRQAKMLDAVHRNARRLQTLVEDMLTISKIELGAFTSELRPMDLAGVVPAAAEIMRPSALESGLGFTVDCPGRGLMIDGDPEQLDRVLINLLSNAVKYTPPGGSVALTAAAHHGYAVVTVADTGMGIPAREQRALFTRFFRASNAVERAIPGSGLGLSIVRTVVANHHGEVSLTSSEGMGTTVTVRIPLLTRPQPGPDDAVINGRRPVPLPRRYHQEWPR